MSATATLARQGRAGAGPWTTGHDALPERLRAAVLLGAFAGLRDAEVCGLRVSDVDFMRGIINPAVQHPAQPLKTDASRAALPIPQSLALALSAHVAQWSAEGFVFVNEWGDQLAPWTLQRAIRTAREKVPGLPPDFRFHDLRHKADGGVMCPIGVFVLVRAVSGVAGSA